MASFADWTMDDATKALATAITDCVTADAFASNKAYAEEKDHYQGGDGWIGPGAGIVDRSTRVLALRGTAGQNGVEKQFTPVDVTNEVLDRVANALMQREADVSFQPVTPAKAGTAEETAQIAVADAMRVAASVWWDRVKMWAKSRQALKRSRWAGRGNLRLWIPSGHLVEKTVDDKVVQSLPTGLKLPEALARIELDAPLPDAAAVYTDTATQKKVGIAQYSITEESMTVKVIELWYVDGDDTVIRVLRDDNQPSEPVRLRMGQRLPILEMEADLLITEPVRRQQARLNFVESILVRIAETAGFAERYIADAAPNGIWLQTPPPEGTALLEKQTFEGVTWYLHAAPRTLGSAITTELRGRQITDDTGSTHHTTPNVFFKDPTDPDFAIKSADHARATILKQCKQGHVAIEGTAEASGTAYQQARADFEADLNGVKGPLETIVRETIEAAIAMAESMGTPSKFLEEYRCIVNLNVTSGPITPAEMEQNNQNVKSGTLSAETAMAKNGVEDVGAETERMRNDPDAVITLRTKQVNAITLLTGEGIGWQLAAKIVGVADPEVLTLFEQADKDAQEARDQEDTEDDEIAAALKRRKKTAPDPELVPA